MVPSYDEGIDYFVNTLSFTKTSDLDQGEGKRWVAVLPPNCDTTGCTLILTVPSDEKQKAAVGNQTGGRVFLFLYTDNFWGDYAKMKEKGVQFMEEPRKEVYGTVVVFRDPWGNTYDFMGKAGEWNERLGMEETLTSCAEV